MLGSQRNIKIFSVLFHSLAIAIIVFGSIINFHQYKIWGKPLIPQFVGIKRDVEKATKILPNGKLVLKNNFEQTFSSQDAAVIPAEVMRHNSGPACLITLDLCFKGPGFQHLLACGLRAPPLS
ncbi:MAG: hypothetical protein NTU51_11150 [Bacteroidetes bacterium]|nr:hypothetical protein [Bacteroidota bacterium]